MKENRKTNIKVGLTVLIALLIFIWILGWAKRITIAGDYNVLRMRFDSVSGLEIGDHITINGVKMGKVHDIKIDGNYVLVEGYIPKTIVIKKDAQAKVEMMDLMGGKKIELKPGMSDEVFDFNNVLEGKLSTDIPGALAMVGNVEQDLKTIIIDTRNLLEQINKNFSEKEMISSIKNSVKNLEMISYRLDELLSRNNKNLETTLKNITSITEKTNQFLVQNSDSLVQTFVETRQLISNLNKVVNSIDTILIQTSEKENNIGRIIYDKEIYEKLRESVIKLDEISKILLEQLNSKGIKVDAKIRLF